MAIRALEDFELDVVSAGRKKNGGGGGGGGGGGDTITVGKIKVVQVAVAISKCGDATATNESNISIG